MSLHVHESSTGWCRRRLANATLRQRRIVGLIGVYLAVYLLIDARAITQPYLLTGANNLNVAEAQAWLAGRLHLDADPAVGKRPWDSAVFDGRVYNVFPPMFTLVSAAVVAVVRDGVPNVVLIVLLALPLPGLAYALFLRRTQRVVMAVLLSLGYLLGTSLLPLMNRGLRDGDVWSVNHLLSQLGLLILLLDYFGRRRIWPAGIGLIVAAWSRQLTVLYLIPVLYAAAMRGTVKRQLVRGRSADDHGQTSLTVPPSGLERSTRRSGLVTLAVVTALLVALPTVLNALKFANPFDSGYSYIYEGRGEDAADSVARDARRGLFSVAFMPRNLYYMNLGLPELDSPAWMVRFVPNPAGTGIWWTTPLLLFVLTDWRKLCADRDQHYLLGAAGLVFAVLMMYHTTGRLQPGYNRFSMDFVIVVLAVIGPACDGPRRKWMSLAFVLWSVWYFRWAI